MNQWLEDVRQYGNNSAIKVLVANKSDTEQGLRAVDTLQGEALARDLDVDLFFEVSAKSGSNI